MLRRVIVETPHGNVSAVCSHNYLIRCLRDCIFRGEAPFTSRINTNSAVFRSGDPFYVADHYGYMDDEWRAAAHATVVYTDYGITGAMKASIANAEKIGCFVEHRSIGVDVTDMNNVVTCAGCLISLEVSAIGQYLCTDCR